MRNNTILLGILASCSLFVGACASEGSDSDEKDLLGLGDDDCSDDEEGDNNDNCGSDDGSSEDGDDGDGSGGSGGSGDDEGDDDETEITADAYIEIVGSGIYLGLDEECTDLEGNFYAYYDAEVVFDSEEDRWMIDSVNDQSLEIEDDCECSNESVEVDAVVSITAHVRINSDEESCEEYCDVYADQKADAECDDSEDSTNCHADVYADAMFVCSETCESSDGTIMAHATIDASLDIDLDEGDDDSLEDLELDLEFDDLLDSEVNVIELD